MNLPLRPLSSSVLVALLCVAAIPAQDTSLFTRTEAMIPTRDGVKLHTVIFSPRDAREPLPILLERTPYGAMDDEEALRDRCAHLIADGYIFAFQDIRGRFKSEGQFVMQRQVRDKHDPKAIDEGTDTYDTIDWLIHHVKGHNGRVGMLGISYGGWLTTMALLDPHPALKAASEQASPADMFLGDDFHHNGAFRLSYGFEYAALLETSKESNTHFAFDIADTYQWYLKLGALPNADERYFHGQIPTWNDFVNHPDYDTFWQQQAFAPHIGTPKVPNLNVAGWWDQEDFYGPVKIYELFEKNDPDHLNYLVAGPWNHGGWARRDGSKLGEIPFDSNTCKYFRQHIEAPWFAYWLKDKGARDFRRPRSFRPDRIAGSGTIPGRRRAPETAICICTRTAPSPSTRRLKGMLSIATSPTRPTPCRIATGLSVRLIPPAAGPPGWWKISASWTTGPTC